MPPTNREGRSRRRLCALFVAGLIASALLLAACGSSSNSGSGSSGANASTKTNGASGGNPETTVYAPGVPTLKQLYESSNEAPPASGPSAAKGKEVIWVSCGQQAVGCRVAAEGFMEAAKVLGWKARIIDGKLNVDNGFATGIRTAIAAKPAAIITFGIGCEEQQTPFQEAKAAGIPVVETNTPDCSEKGGPELFAVKNEFNKKALSASEFYERYGENQASYVVDKTAGKAKVLVNEWTGTAGKKIGAGWKKVFAKCSGCTILDNVGWEAAEQAPNGPMEQKFRTALTKYPEANSAIITFDSNATYGGLANAIVEANRQHNMVLVSGEGFNETLELIREEKGLTAEAGAWDQSKWFPWEVADELNRHFNGQPSVPEGIGLAVIDKEHNMPPKGENYKANVDFAKAYEEVWGGKKG